MNFNLKKDELFDIIKAFYDVTGIHITIWNIGHNEWIGYPSPERNKSSFCKLMHSHHNSGSQCWNCDDLAMRKSYENNCFIYRCHAGLTECIIQIKEREIPFGFVIIGQVSDVKDETERKEQLLNICRSYGFSDEEAVPAANSVPYFTTEYIKQAAKIAEACANYIMTRELITFGKNQIVSRAKNFISDNIFKNNNVTVEDVCNSLSVSRTALYNAFKAEGEIGISKYILSEKMKYAREMLIKTQFPIYKISSLVGFADYNYFSKVYKKFYGRSPSSYR